LWVLLVLVAVSVILGAIGRALQDKGRSVERHRE
jgi:hypothetical protein